MGKVGKNTLLTVIKGASEISVALQTAVKDNVVSAVGAVSDIVS